MSSIDNPVQNMKPVASVAMLRNHGPMLAPFRNGGEILLLLNVTRDSDDLQKFKGLRVASLHPVALVGRVATDIH
jgi:hypothetical protein